MFKMKKLDINPLLNAYESFFHALEFVEMIESGNLDNIDYGDEFARTLVIHHF
jgi:hypothetical protein